MTPKRSRTESEKELEIEMLIQAKTIESFLKVIQRTEGRKKIQGLIQELSEEVNSLNKNFETYSKSIKSK